MELIGRIIKFYHYRIKKKVCPSTTCTRIIRCNQNIHYTLPQKKEKTIKAGSNISGPSCICIDLIQCVSLQERSWGFKEHCYLVFLPLVHGDKGSIQKKRGWSLKLIVSFISKKYQLMHDKKYFIKVLLRCIIFAQVMG